jgi:GINS complex subunit 4
VKRVGLLRVSGGAGAAPPPHDGDATEWGHHDLPNDVEVLKRVWRNEKSAPEILAYEALLVERVQEQVALMEDNLVAYAESLDDMMLSIFEMDVNRLMFLLRAYLRVRMSKIEKFALHIMRTPQLWDRLSPPEQDHAHKFVDALSKHMHDSVLGKLEKAYDSLMKQAASSDDNDMILEPNLDTFIFCRSKTAVGSFQLDDK